MAVFLKKAAFFCEKTAIFFVHIKRRKIYALKVWVVLRCRKVELRKMWVEFGLWVIAGRLVVRLVARGLVQSQECRLSLCLCTAHLQSIPNR